MTVLRANLDDLAALVTRVADETGIPAAQVEKDYWLTEALRGANDAAASVGTVLVFKGGTSLSKAFKAIDRFSEDVDLLVRLDETATAGARDRVLKSIMEGAANCTGLPATPVPAATSKGVRRGARYFYRDDGGVDGLSDGVFLELGSRGGMMPTTSRSLVSLLAEHAAEDMAEFDESGPVVLEVLDPTRTLVEKLHLLHTIRSLDDETFPSKLRHYYDVWCLLGTDPIIAGLTSNETVKLAMDIDVYSARAAMPTVPRPKGGYSQSPAFDLAVAADGDVAAAFDDTLRQLLWPRSRRPTLLECIRSVHDNASKL